MAEVLVSPLVKVLLEKSTSHAFDQYGKMWGLKKMLAQLESTLSTIRAVLRDAEEKQMKNEELKDWLGKLKDAAYEAEDILDEFNYEVLRQKGETRDRMKRKVWDFFSFHNPIIYRIRMINKIKEIVERLDSIAAEKSKFHLTEISPILDRQHLIKDRPQSHSFVDESNTIGREEDKKKIVELLISRAGRSDVSVLPIIGIGGLGKTTLAQLVYNEERVAEHFTQRIWVCVSEDFDINKIVEAIIESATGEQFTTRYMDILQRKLRAVLRGNRFLLVLDDVWNPWEELKELLTTGAEGSCIIVTTRSTAVAASTVGTLDAYVLRPLSEDECWSLFERNAFCEGGVEKSANLMRSGKAIAEKCGGLPLAAKMMGRLMRTKRQEQEWRSVMESRIWELKDDKILPSLRLSYTHLPSHVKQCFAFCAIFPKDYEIDKQMLIQLWMANGFIPFDPKEDMELKGHEIFDELLSRSFFQDFKEIPVDILSRQSGRMREYFSSRVSWSFFQDYDELRFDNTSKHICRMHDVVHDLAQSIMGDECCILDKPGSISNTTLRHLSVTMDDPKLSIAEKMHAFRTVRTLLLLRDRKSTNIDLSHVNWAETKLRVLGLEESMINDFPISKLHVRHLRYLDLSATDIAILPEATSGLLNLQTLNLSYCIKLQRLPKGIRKMSSLRHFYLHGCINLESMPRGIGELRCLRTLTAYSIGKETGSGSIKELEGLCIGDTLELRGVGNVRSAAEAEVANLGSKQDLQYLRLFWLMLHDESGKGPEETELEEMELEEGNAEKVLEALQPPQGLKWFRILHYPGKRFPTWLMGGSMLLQNLVKIQLIYCTGCEHLPQLGRLPYLEILEIKGLLSVKRMGGEDFYGSVGGGDQHDVIFPSLKTLQLTAMHSLEEWSGVQGSPSFPKLEELVISECPKLGSFLNDSQQHLTTPGCLTALKILMIIGCGNLISLPIELQQRLPNLGFLNIQDCPELEKRCEIGGEYWALISCIQNKYIGR